MASSNNSNNSNNNGGRSSDWASGGPGDPITVGSAGDARGGGGEGSSGGDGMRLRDMVRGAVSQPSAGSGPPTGPSIPTGPAWGRGWGRSWRGGQRGRGRGADVRHNPYNRPPRGGQSFSPSVGTGTGSAMVPYSGGSASGGISLAASSTAVSFVDGQGRTQDFDVEGCNAAGEKLTNFISAGEGRHAVAFKGDGPAVLGAAYNVSSQSSGSRNVRGFLTTGMAPLASDLRKNAWKTHKRQIAGKGYTALLEEEQKVAKLKKRRDQLQKELKEKKKALSSKAVSEGSAAGEDVDMEVAGCRNCGREGHVLLQCARAGPGGPIAICPLCEDDGHCVDECPKWEDMPDSERLDILVYSRACKPRWKTASLEWHTVAQSAKEAGALPMFRLPWTDEFAVLAMVEYKASIEGYEASLRELLLPNDPETATLEKAIEHFKPLVCPDEVASATFAGLADDLDIELSDEEEEEDVNMDADKDEGLHLDQLFQEQDA